MGEEEHPGVRLAFLTGLTLLAFAANSLLCRAALGDEGMDAASFTLLRLGSGALALFLLLRARGRSRDLPHEGSWTSAWALLGYAFLFSLAYGRIPAGVGALVLFAAVQLTMLAAAVWAGHGPARGGWLGVALAVGGLAVLALPGARRPDVAGVVLMAGSGVAWGLYSLRGRGSARPVSATAANFLRATVLGLPVCAAAAATVPPSANVRGLALAVTSGAVTSGLGYVLWYAVLPRLGTTRAAVVQLLVPVIAAVGGVLLLAEAISLRLVLASLTILGGIALVFRSSR